MATGLWKYRIRKLSVRGFKSIAERQSIEITPLTILAGANSSGKSSMMQPLLLLKQTLEASFDPGPLWISGPNVKFTAADQFLSRVRLQNGSRSLDIELGIGGDARLGFTFSKGPKTPIDIDELRWTDDDKPHVIRREWTSEDVRSRFKNVDSVSRERFWLRLVSARERDDSITASLRSSFATRVPINFLGEVLLKLLHVPGIRGNPERTYPITGTGPNFPGTFQYYVASVIARWQSENSPNYEHLNNDLQRVGLAPKVVARRLNDAEIDLLVGRLAGGKPDDLVSVADVGLGIAHILPVLVALRTAVQGQLVYIEQPEIHLHPRAQVRLVEVLADAAKRGVRVVAETHSALILTAIQALVAKEELKPELVKLHWFQRDPKTGVTKVTPTGLNDRGAFSKRDWPEDFDEVILSAEREYLDAVTERSGR
jgi:hypothetical protein